MKMQVVAEFDSCIRRMFTAMPPDKRDQVRKWLLNHERKPVCVERLCEQIQLAEQAANIGGKFDRRRFDSFIDTAARLFADAAIRLEADQAMSHAEKQKLKDAVSFEADATAEQAELQKELNSTRIVGKPLSIVPGV